MGTHLLFQNIVTFIYNICGVIKKKPIGFIQMLPFDFMFTFRIIVFIIFPVFFN
jgi:hypothetical protein